jgi:hypothetical protein
MQTACFLFERSEKSWPCRCVISTLNIYAVITTVVKQSDFPYFYVLTKAMYEKKQRGKKLSKKDEADVTALPKRKLRGVW